MGFLSNMVSAVVKTALTPVAIAADVINVVTDSEVDATKKLLNSASDDVSESVDDLGDGEFL